MDERRATLVAALGFVTSSRRRPSCGARHIEAVERRRGTRAGLTDDRLRGTAL